MAYRLPEAITAFNVYNDTDQLIGVTGSVELPTITQMTNTISNAGMLGEYEAPVVGHTNSFDIKIPFGQIDENEYFTIVRSEENIILRGSIQTRNIETNKIENVQILITMRGATKEYALGTVEKAKTMNASVTKVISYIKIIINNVVCLELDKFNSIYIVDGVDMFEEVRSQI